MMDTPTIKISREYTVLAPVLHQRWIVGQRGRKRLQDLIPMSRHCRQENQTLDENILETGSTKRRRIPTPLAPDDNIAQRKRSGTEARVMAATT